MKLWKGATFAFMLCGAALSTILIRNMATIGQFKLKTKHANTSSPTSRLSSPSESTSIPSSTTNSRVLSQQTGGPHRRIRSTEDNMNTLLSEFSTMLQSFTEGELQHVVETLLDRKRRKIQPVGKKQPRRTKRERRSNACSLRKVVLKVSELGLGYESEETVKVRYCSGKCTAFRNNYDLAMKHMDRPGGKLQGHKYNISGPCCRPTEYEMDLRFLGSDSKYHVIQNVSAKACKCV